MNQDANLCRTVPNGTASGREEKLVESRGVESLTDSTASAASQTTIQPRRQRWALPAGLTEGDLQRGYAQAVRP
ncbi:MAG: hypothetical protein EKK55_08800 [Rhodocyclaceae bacterium]|nr:MAG: hypothetical protein EKK55_08800 [Rhodocyclaceae bacterium]